MRPDRVVPINAHSCPNRLVVEQIADKWSLLVLAALWGGPMRFNAIRRSVEGITQKALTQTLRKLERNGIVARRVLATSPVSVEYSVTPIGLSLQGAFDALHAWAVENRPAVEEARIAFEARSGER
ncbi:winged helix-turn-helix transcriptional regulator [Aureimonas mangrovi]|uniref:winged helix-turn-helix transcriptional regulator n=1 Tax=Aureimonas mangrovi TaxID=2758041 RepID=UPI00163DE54B|nr:helix-turn-helix domain-containing protein [Aureimonas mangrovi]